MDNGTEESVDGGTEDQYFHSVGTNIHQNHVTDTKVKQNIVALQIHNV